MYGTSSGEAYVEPLAPYSFMAAFTGDPTYQQCVDDTGLQSSVGVSQGASFCFFEPSSGIVAGGVVIYIDASAINPSSVTVQFTVWEN